MRGWLYLLGGLLLWTVHFFAIYVVASVFLTSGTSRLLTALVTIACLAVAALLIVLGWRGRTASHEPDDRWTHTIAALAGVSAFIAIAWQGLPALLI